ncbi:hypothetical protein [Commensalibacter oyaizuii]|uniref:Uncharacterized protein n=1 Tax=Commensalibacter oyaizuii TaxID=3043873 RepID=A0ABT6Q0G0_9PROT|nr:hypothetical protein [Commensalibacter sp. TBRC 16381]MDI2090605.1 hypothetical protein [Commensalibacter sp. TBRC 16381]
MQSRISLQFQGKGQDHWSVFPSKTVISPIIQTIDEQNHPKIIWQARKVTLFYSLRHPLSISITVDGEQIFCPPFTNKCFQIHGYPWQLQIPLFFHIQESTLFFSCPQSFYNNAKNVSFTPQLIELKNIQGQFHWNLKADYNKSLFFTQFDIQQTLIIFNSLTPQYLNNIEGQFALTGKQHDAINIVQSNQLLYKLLIQKLKFTWKETIVTTMGKVSFPFPNLRPTGELNTNLQNIPKTLYNEISKINCCFNLKRELSQIPVPSQLYISIPIRDGTIYLGTIPLESSLFQNMDTILKRYAK